MSSNVSTAVPGIDLPLPPYPARHSTAAWPAEDQGPSLGILVVEDDAVQAAELKKALQGLGHQVVRTACNGQEACQLCLELKPDLVLMDLGLPGMDGLQAAFVINHRQPLPVVLITSRLKTSLVEEASRAGVYTWLLKPVDADLLGRSLELALHNFQRLEHLENQVEELRREIRTRKLVGRASGILMQRLGIDEQGAVQRLHQKARSQGLSLLEVAESVISAGEVAGLSP